MKLSAINLFQFRGVSHLQIDFDEKITILVGRNGVGKSTVLDALAIMLQRYQSAWVDEKTRPWSQALSVLNARDVQLGRNDYKLKLDFSLEDVIGENIQIDFEISYVETTRFRQGESFEYLKKFIQNQTFSSGEEELLLYYRQNRGFDDRTSRANETSSLFGSLNAISQLEVWWDRRDAEEARRVRDVDPEYRDPQLEAVRALIKEVDGYVGVGFSAASEQDGIYFVRADGAKIHVSSLSTGERSFIILLADLARRLQLTKPGTPLHEIPAIVLIDEIELNLHPSWQSKIISTLTRVFASCQFVVTTHSPQVISSVESRHVRTLTKDGDDILVGKPLRTKGQTSNYLLEGVFGAHERDPEVDQLIDVFNNAVDKGDYTAARARLKEIYDKIEGDPPELVVLQKRLKSIQPAS